MGETFGLVTPCVGVWIETCYRIPSALERGVTPCVGVWIETLAGNAIGASSQVTPCVGVWIETIIVIYF